MNKDSLKVSDIGEKALIERIIAKNSSCSTFNSINDYPTAIGDDSALTDVIIGENSYLVSSSDMLIQSTHFPEGMSYYQMGFKSVAVNISDLIAMGAEPIGFLLNIAVPNNMILDDFDELVCGVVGACDYYNMPLIGGDTNEGNEIIISVLYPLISGNTPGRSQPGVFFCYLTEEKRPGMTKTITYADNRSIVPAHGTCFFPRL